MEDSKNTSNKTYDQIEFDPVTGDVVLVKNTNHNKTSYVCHICNKSFVKKSYSVQHVKSHSEKFSCHICNNKFTHHHHLNQHMKIHEDNKEYKCEVCGKDIRYKFNLVSHMKTHIKYYDIETGTTKYLK
jgi:uncharacterized Zn-finger protein